jgi:general secretion pathway protein N
MAKFSNASTLLLASFLVWAGLVMLVAIFGLGARFNPLPVDARLAKPIPTVKISQNKATLEPISAYLEVGTRPLLMLDRRPGPVPAAAGDNSAAELDVSLGSVLITATLKMALFRENKDGTSRRVRLGDLIDGTAWRLVQLEPRRAILEGPGGQRSIDLLVFNGKGGESPTAVAVAAAVPQDNSNVVQNAAPVAVPVAQTTPGNSNAMVGNTASINQSMTQEQQIEAIRQRIAARRAQMQADAAKAASDAKK